MSDTPEVKPEERIEELLSERVHGILDVAKAVAALGKGRNQATHSWGGYVRELKWPAEGEGPIIATVESHEDHGKITVTISPHDGSYEVRHDDEVLANQGRALDPINAADMLHILMAMEQAWREYLFNERVRVVSLHQDEVRKQAETSLRGTIKRGKQLSHF